MGYPNRLELYAENSKPELIFMDQIDEITTDLVQVKNEQCIILRTRSNESKHVLTNNDEIGLKEWSSSLRNAHKCSTELFSSLAKKAGRIYGTDGAGSASAVSSTSNLSTSATSAN